MRTGTLLLLGGAGVAGALGSMVRIVPAEPPPQRGAPPSLVASATPAPVAPALLLVPVRGIDRAALRDSWGDSRAAGQRAHQGIDIPAPAGTPVLAAAPGVVEKLFYSHGGGGITAYVRSEDRAWTYYYAHLQGYAPGLAEGTRVRAGDVIGFVGDTGNAGTGNFHLHFGVAGMAPGERWHQGVPINPYPLLAGSPGRR